MPTDDKTLRGWEASFPPSALQSPRSKALMRTRAGRGTQAESPKVEDLTTLEAEKRTSIEVVSNSQGTTQTETQPKRLLKRRMFLPLLPSASPSSNGNNQVVLPEHPKNTLTTPRASQLTYPTFFCDSCADFVTEVHEPRGINNIFVDAKKSRLRVENNDLVKLSSVSPLQRKAPKPPHDGPLRSKLAPVSLGPRTTNASSADAFSWVERLPKEVTVSPAASGPLSKHAEAADSTEPSRKRRRVSTVVDEQELAIFTEASTQHRHFITAKSLREVIAEKRAKLTHTPTEAQMKQVEEDKCDEAKEDEDEIT